MAKRSIKEAIFSNEALNDVKYDSLFAIEGKRGKSGNKFLSKIAKMNAWPLILSTLVYILQASPVWVTPLVTSYIINVVTGSMTTGAGVGPDLWRKIIIAVVILLVLILLNVPTTTWRAMIVSKMCRKTSAGIKCAVVRKLQSLSITYHKDMQMGKIQSKFLKDTDSVDSLLGTIVRTLLPTLVGVVVSVVISVLKNGWVALFFLVVIPFNMALSMVFRKKMRKVHRAFRVSTEKMSIKLTSMLQMMQVTKAHGLEETELEQFSNRVGQHADSGMATDKTVAYFGSSSWALNHVLSAACLVFCVILAIYGQIEVGDIVLYQTMFTQITGYVSTIINIYPHLAGGFEALNSVSEIMNASDIESTFNDAKTPKIMGDVRFEDVSYRYPNTEQLVVKNFSLDVKHGECIAVVGASGSGKSTLMNMIIGFLKPIEGEIYIDGQPITQMNLSGYRRNISVVPQNSILFAGTIRENITYGLDGYSEEDFERVLDMANIREFLPDLPKGLETDIGEYGDKLSGGQRQRITIARALIRNPKILILDEATSALDNISEYHVQQAISSSIRGRTTFIVAHRLSTIRDADRIVVMDGGEIAEIGTYDELMEKQGKFYELKILNDATAKKAEEGLNQGN